MKIALPEWNGRLSPVFDTCGMLTTVEVVDGQSVGRQSVPLLPEGPTVRAGRLAELGVDVLLCGAISQELLRMIETRGVRVMSFLSGTVDDVLAAYMGGTLSAPSFRMPGCGGRGMGRGAGAQRARRGRCGRRNNGQGL